MLTYAFVTHVSHLSSWNNAFSDALEIRAYLDTAFLYHSKTINIVFPRAINMAYSHQDNRSSMPNHPANIHSNINPAHLAILFQTCFACGLSAAALLNPQETGHPSK